MADTAIEEPLEQPPAAAPRRRRRWGRRIAIELATLLAGLVLLALVALIFLDSDPGHRWIADRIAATRTATGLGIRVGRIDGSIWGNTRLHGVEVSDTKGVFVTAPEIVVDWSPAAWLTNNLDIDRIDAPRVIVSRLPALRPSGKAGSLLPNFDIRIGRLAIARLDLLAPVTGTARSGRVVASATIRAGRAMVDLQARLDGGGDRLALRLDADPDRDRFDLGVNLIAPADGLVPALVGVRRPIALRIVGDGRWSDWRGQGALDLSGQPAARLALTARSGRYALSGTAAPSRFTAGTIQRLTGPMVTLSGQGTMPRRWLLEGQFRAASPALRAVIDGGIDLGTRRWNRLTLGGDLLQPKALFPAMRGKQVRLLVKMDGPWGTADFAYRLRSPDVGFDTIGFTDVLAEGQGKFTPWPMRVPLRLTARRITGIGSDAGAMLANARLNGVLSLDPTRLRGDNLQLTSDKLKAKLSVLLDFASGRFDVMLSGGLNRYLIPGLGIVDVTTDLHVVPGPGGKGTRIVGTGKAIVRRLDNDFFRNLAGGLPRIETRLERLPDGTIRFTDLQLFAPKLRLSGSGLRRPDGTFRIEASGRQAQYGPLRLLLDGPITRPRVELLLASPNPAMGLSQVRVSLAPDPSGYAYRASGGSRLGPFTSNGRILLPRNGAATIAIAALDVSGIRGQGTLRSDPGGFTGRLALTGGGLLGDLFFSPAAGGQKIEAHLTASNLRLAGPPALAVRDGRLDGTILLADASTTLDGVLSARGVDTAGLSLSRLTANARLVNGSGQVRAAFAGRRGSAFEFSALADVAPNQYRISGQGSVAGRPLTLATPAVITAEGDGWRIAPTSVRFAGGSATVSGRTGSRPEILAELSAMPLTVLDIVNPTLDLGGLASGRLSYRWADGRPSGRVDLQLRGLSRAGLVLASKPIDVGLAAVLDGRAAAMRAVAVSDGKTIGRAQARFAPLGGGPIVAALLNAPMFAQVRYAGPVDTLWRLTGSEILDMSGPIAIGADINGRLLSPVIRGSLRTTGARLESAVTGMVLTDVAASGRFAGSRLVLDRMTGRSGPGSISGSGSIDFAGGTSPALDLAFQASNARLLGRDDIAAQVTGPIAIRSSGSGGRISGNLVLDTGRFTLGRASAAAKVPQLAVRHVNLASDDDIEPADLKPWALDMTVRGRDLQVSGLGIDSRWSTDLKVGGTADAPRLTGTANLVRGDYDFAGRSFRLSRGVIRFRGESPPDPSLDIVAQSDVQSLNAKVSVTGTGLKPEIAFTSVPALPQDELLSRLLFGTSITNLSAPEALQLASAVAALRSGSGGLDPINAVRRAVGLDRLRILPADIATGQKAAISAGKYIGRKLFVEVITDGQGYSATRIEYQVTRWLSLLSSINTIGRTSANVRVSKDY